MDVYQSLTHDSRQDDSIISKKTLKSIEKGQINLSYCSAFKSPQKTMILPEANLMARYRSSM